MKFSPLILVAAALLFSWAVVVGAVEIVIGIWRMWH